MASYRNNLAAWFGNLVEHVEAERPTSGEAVLGFGHKSVRESGGVVLVRSEPFQWLASVEVHWIVFEIRTISRSGHSVLKVTVLSPAGEKKGNKQKIQKRLCFEEPWHGGLKSTFWCIGSLECLIGGAVF
jgi:hypothetical protein